MKNKDLKYLETATIDELKSILNSISKNINVLSLDYSLTDDLMEGLMEILGEEHLEYLYENYEDDIDEDEMDSITESFIKSINNKDLKFFEPYFENVSNFKNYNRWLFSFSSEIEFPYWAEFNFIEFFENNFKLSSFKK